jgi:hypothetical protein
VAVRLREVVDVGVGLLVGGCDGDVDRVGADVCEGAGEPEIERVEVALLVGRADAVADGGAGCVRLARAEGV